MNDRSSALRVFYILYPDGYFSSNDLEEVGIVKTSIGQHTKQHTNLFHGKWMDDFTPVIGEFRRLVWPYYWYKTCCGHFSWIGSEYAIDLFPYLKFGGFEANSE